ncbi:MAG: hypothetical protein D6744_10780 [Planctomycetota bacterium]|nr:MAG: hypothetical protein D6744_10780 [Planctomycetota bacterium]
MPLLILALFALSVAMWVDAARGGTVTRRVCGAIGQMMLIFGNLFAAVGDLIADAGDAMMERSATWDEID